MSSFGLLTVPSRQRRKSSSTSTSISIDSHIYGFGGAAPSSSPPSSPPLLTPLHLARPYEHATWQTGDYSDDLDEAICNQREVDDNFWSRPTRSEHSVSYLRHLPSLVTKFATPILWGDALPYSPSPFTSTSETAYFYPQGDSAIADDCEEYDLESMDIHIHETYFATSAERGRWLSSPIASRVRSHVGPHTCSYSSPVKTLANASREHTNSCAILEDHDEDMHCSSSLPPSSPLSSPLSDHCFLGDDSEDNAIGNPCPNPNDSVAFCATPAFSISSMACTSPVEPARPSTPRKPTIASPHPSLHSPIRSSNSAISFHTSSRLSRSPDPVDDHAHAPEADFESDGPLSPLSQFELDLPEPEPLKVPLSGVENKLYSGQHTANPGVNTNTVQSHSGSLSVQVSSKNDESFEVSLEIVGGVKAERGTKRRRENTTKTRQTKKRTEILSRSTSSDGKRKSGVENHTSNDLEPLSKRSRLSRRKDDRGEKSRRNRSGPSKSERRRRPPSRPAIERCDTESAHAYDSKTPDSTVPLQQPASRDPALMEFHASLTGMLVEAFALSRATSMDSSSLYLVLTQAHPQLAAERSKQTFLMDIVDVLEAGRVRCGMFEKVDCSGERSRHRPLESRWFYVPERDEDGERASLISAIMPRQKRNETKKYKQYYYRPLEKMSRWDPEDAP